MSDSTIPGLLPGARRPGGVETASRRDMLWLALLIRFRTNIGFIGLHAHLVALFATRWDWTLTSVTIHTHRADWLKLKTTHPTNKALQPMRSPRRCSSCQRSIVEIKNRSSPIWCKIWLDEKQPNSKLRIWFWRHFKHWQTFSQNIFEPVTNQLHVFLIPMPEKSFKFQSLGKNCNSYKMALVW